MKTQSGFTRIEIIVVVIIDAVFSAIVGALLSTRPDSPACFESPIWPQTALRPSTRGNNRQG